MSASPEPASAPPPSDPGATVDERSPWLGLVSFTEETRAFFFGRHQEVAELSRRVQGKLLTVLFGKSGLGKTSILRAGLVPRLREHGYCPVYVRIDYRRDTPEPAEQIKEAIRRAANASGEWTQVGVAAAGESLWEFLHHRDDVLRDDSGAALIPLLIFDQFEELFTLAQGDDFGRARAARFIEELADLVENRPPKALDAQFEQDEAAAERFDFARSDYRVLIALREDYLAPLESLKKLMPSLSQNRLRLAPMTGVQALEAVLRPGRNLVSEEVAEAIVRFVADGAELANAEVEPSLLSLICRELNDARLAQGRSEISLDLLAGSHATILTNFYERALADQPTSVRRIIEDDLLTESGFRENVAEESLLKRFAAAGAAPGALATLVNRRLLRIEERLDVRRVELIHDVLCGVVKANRDQRHESEAREEAERVLAEQRAREQAARHALRRVRAIAIGCILLAVFALCAAVFAYLSAQRAQHAEHLAQQSRTLAEQARNHSEQLLGYLSDDFARELASFGQLQVIAQFTQREIDYFHALPPQLRSAETVRNGALALIEHARALDALGEYDGELRNASEAVSLLEGLRRSGDGSEATVVALGRAYGPDCAARADLGQAGSREACQHGAAILQPLADRPGASLPARRAYLEALRDIGWVEQYNATHYEHAVQVTQQAMQLAVELGAKNLTDMEVSAEYASAGASRVAALTYLGRDKEALRVGKDALTVADGVLERRPWYRLTLRGKESTESMMAVAAYDELDPRETMNFALEGQQSALALIRLDPSNDSALNDFIITLRTVGESLWAGGRVDEGVDWHLTMLGAWANQPKGARFGLLALNVGPGMTDRVYRQALAGDLTGAARVAASVQRLIQLIIGRQPPDSIPSLCAELPPRLVQAEAAYERNDFTEASRRAAQATERLANAKPQGPTQKIEAAYLLYYFSSIYGRTEYQLGHFVASESAERVALAQVKIFLSDDISAVANQRKSATFSTWLSMALARQGKLREAAQVIGPVVSFEESLLARDHGDVWVPYDLAGALYAQSLSDPARREALLHRASLLLNGLPPRLQKLHDVQQWRRMISRQ
ncbi:MAG TPA: hypothetical protein VFY39_08310 [Gammaproteobacteria bacterium]|nr:hypothetical protein [Gammaproteobacteria bacterium]